MIKYVYLISLVVFIGCEDPITVDDGPCKFAPPTSNFATYTEKCEDCYFNINIAGVQYKFRSDQLLRSFQNFPEPGVYSYKTVLFEFQLGGPKTVRSLLNVDDRNQLYTSFNTPEEIDKNSQELNVSLQLTNYCKTVFDAQFNLDPFSGKDSYHKIKETKLIKLDYYGDDYSADFLVSGEFVTYFLFEGEYKMVSGNYQVPVNNVPF